MQIDSFFINYVFLVILLFLSSFFSGSEAAFFSLNRLERNSLKEKNSKKKKHILTFLLNHPEQLLITILTGNMVVNIVASSIGSVIGEEIFKGKSEIFSIIGMTLLLLIFGELTPKRIAVNHSKIFADKTAYPLYYLYLFLTPARIVLNNISAWFLNLFKREITTENEVRHALVLSTAELGYKQSILMHSEYRLFKSYLAFRDKSANSVMTQRNTLNTLAFDMKIGEAIDLISVDSKYIMNLSVLLHKEDKDHLYGWIPISRLLECKYKDNQLNDKISTLANNFYTVPKSKDLPTLILEMREENVEIALLIDEFGGTAGVLWFRNIIEDLLHVFYNPFYKNKKETKRPLNKIPGTTSIEDLQELLGVDIDFNVDTAAGLFLEIFGNIPDPGDKVQFKNYQIRVLDMDGNRINNLNFEERKK